MNPFLLCDFYKICHKEMYPSGLTKLVSYWCPRMSRIEDINEVVMFGLQGFINKYLVTYFNDNFFNKPVVDVLREYATMVKYTMGMGVDTTHIKDLHALGYLPLEIKAVPEGTLVPVKVPMIQITNTHDDFAWLVNYIETLMSCHIWQPMTSATIAHRYREIMSEYYDKTVVDGEGHVIYGAGDFSMRGMSSLECAEVSGAGFLLSFNKTATIPAIGYLARHYDASILRETVGLGVPSTEHSIMSAYGRDELFAYQDLLRKYPFGVVSIVSDTYDYWNVLTNILPQLKDTIMNRDGKLLIRGDSGCPIDIICGSIEPIDTSIIAGLSTLEDCYDYIRNLVEYEVRNATAHGECGDGEATRYFIFNDKMYVADFDIYWNRYDKQYYWIEDIRMSSCQETVLSPEQKGTVEVLWDAFGGHINEKGYKVLDSHIGAIYGDGITLERAKAIMKRLSDKGFAVSNVTLGVGSYSMNMVSRDTLGFALKATHAIIDGKETFIYKEPKTDTDNFKKSQKGMCVVFEGLNNNIEYADQRYLYEMDRYNGVNLLQPVFIDGVMMNTQTLKEIKGRLWDGR